MCFVSECLRGRGITPRGWSSDTVDGSCRFNGFYHCATRLHRRYTLFRSQSRGRSLLSRVRITPVLALMNRLIWSLAHVLPR